MWKGLLELREIQACKRVLKHEKSPKPKQVSTTAQQVLFSMGYWVNYTGFIMDSQRLKRIVEHARIFKGLHQVLCEYGIGWCFCGTGQWDQLCLWLFCLLLRFFILLCCLVQPPNKGVCLILLWLILLCSVIISYRTALFWREQRESEFEGGRGLGDLGGMGGGETVVTMYCMRNFQL